MKKIHIDASTGYDVIVSSGILESCGELIKEVIPECRVAIISDDIVFPLYGETVKTSLEKNGYRVVSYIFKNGENSKNIRTYTEILEFLAENHLTRTDLVVALGGGVCGDMAGFSAATYLRGIRFVQIPTTLLAAVDSSVGGKTGVNLDAGKNLVGAFYQPAMVICDTDTLKTLPEETFADGVSEAIKCGMIRDAKLFEKMRGDFKEDIEEIIAACITIKSRVVVNDEFDRGERQLLNFGHTVGHAIEKCSNFSITHGHAVAMGMMIVTKASERLGLCEKISDSLEETLVKCGLPIKCDFSAEELYKVTLNDKKRAGDSVTLVVPEKIGSCVLHKVKTEELLEYIKKGL